jgi:uncharacterized protein (TIGR00369 family)
MPEPDARPPIDLAALQATTRGFFPELLGLRFLVATRDEVRAELPFRPELCTTPGVMHGGALMAFADTLGAYGTVLNLPAGARTTTLESKTNFFAAAAETAKVVGESVPLHRGGRTMVWQTRISREDGRLVAMVTQTQMVLAAEPSLTERLGAAFARGTAAEQQALLAPLERAGAALYRGWAEHEPNAETRRALLEAAGREDDNAAVLERLLKP